MSNSLRTTNQSIGRLGNQWLRGCAFAPNAEGILTSANGRFGLGAVLMLECHENGRFLMSRKSFRSGYEMNHRLTFPGGMVRATGAGNRVTDWVYTSLKNRLLVEVGIDPSELKSMDALDLFPSVVAIYSVRGHAVSTAIIAFHGVVDHELTPTLSGDTSTYDACWRELKNIWPEVSYANGISLAQLVWGRLAADEAERVQLLLGDAAQRAIGDAQTVGLPRPHIPWE